MELNDIQSMLFHIEYEIPIEEWKVEGIRIYPIIRYMLIDQLLGVKQNFSQSEELSLYDGIYNTLKFMFFDSRRMNQKLRKKNILIVGRNKLRNSSMITNIQTAFPQSAFLEYEPTLNYKYARDSPSRVIQLRLYWIKLLTKMKTRRKIKYHLPEFTEFLFQLNKYGVNTERFTTENVIYQSVLTFNIARYYKKILRKNPIEFCVVIPYYLPEGMGMCLACNQLGIPVADIQHGMIKGNIGYDFWYTSPTTPYELLPTHYHVWSNNDANVIMRWIKQNHVFVGGNLSIGTSDNTKSLKMKDDKRIHILVTLQPSFNPQKIFDAVRLANNDNYFWWIRCHPSMTRSTIENIQMELATQSNCDVSIATNSSLITMLKTVDIHVTGFSSVIMEAEQFGIPSITIDPNAHQRFPHQFEHNTLFEVPHGESLLTIIDIVYNTMKDKQLIRKKDYDPIENLHLFDLFIKYP